MSAPPPKPPRSSPPSVWSWAHNPKAGGAGAIAALLLTLMLIGLELALGRGGRGLEFEDWPGIYAVVGLAAALLIFGVGLGLRALLARVREPFGVEAESGGDDDRQP